MDAAAITAMLHEDRAEWPLHDRESPEWTARDVYTHLAAMMETTTNVLEAKLAGHKIPSFDGGDDEAENKVNAEIQRRYSHMSLEESRAWAGREFERRIAVIRSVPEGAWDAQAEELARADGGEHYRGHRGYIGS
jgi:hypothetical protein